MDLSTSQLSVVDASGGVLQMSWGEVLADREKRNGVAAIFPVSAVHAIVLTQNCDAVRGEYIALCQIDTFSSMVQTPPNTPKKWQSLIVKYTREKLRHFYLPEAAALGFTERMLADFRVVIRIRRADLEAMRDKRLSRLNQIATEHFRESIAQFYRRYPYEEWYPLSRAEFIGYESGSSEAVAPFPWQEDPTPT